MKNYFNKIRESLTILSVGALLASPWAFGNEDKKFQDAEQELSQIGTASKNSSLTGDAPLLYSSRPYDLPRLFTIPTAYSLQSYGLRFGGQGNIHSTMSNMTTEALKASVSIGLGGVAELGYQLEERYTTGNSSDNILMGHFKMQLIKERAYLPALSVSAGQNLRENFRDGKDVNYKMSRSSFDLALSKTIYAGNYIISVHPGVQWLDDKVTQYNYAEVPENGYDIQRPNLRLGVTWQTQRNIVYMFETKYLSPSRVDDLNPASTDVQNIGISFTRAVENNLGVRYYIRNWLCIDAGIRNVYDLDIQEADMKLHANFVGVVPLNTMYTRIENLIRN